MLNNTIVAGALEAQGISGVSLACGAAVMGVRLAFPHPVLGLFDGADILYTLEKPDTVAPNGRYVKYNWRVPVTSAGIKRYAAWPRQGINAPSICAFTSGEAACVTLEWRFAEGRVIGCYTSDTAIDAGLFINGAFAPATVLGVEEVDHATEFALAQGAVVLHLSLAGDCRSRHLLNAREEVERIHYGEQLTHGTAMVYQSIRLAPTTPLYFVMALSEEWHGASSPCSPPVEDRRHGLEAPYHFSVDPAAITRELAAAAAEFHETRMHGAGLCAGVPEAVSGLRGYSHAYDPARQHVMATVNRTWSGPNSAGPIFGWDNFFTAYIAAWDDPVLGTAALEHVVGMFAEHGIARGPAPRNLIIPIMYSRTLEVLGDDALAARTWPTMMAFMRFWFADRGDGRPWRDGNDDGLIDSGASSDPALTPLSQLIAEAMDETGYDDSPIYSAGFVNNRYGFLADGVALDLPSRTLTITQVGQNSLYIASCRAMVRWAERLGKGEDAAWLRAEEARAAVRVREVLYCAEDGIFRDRYWQGGFSPVKTMTLFYPLLAGIADAETQQRLQAMLLDTAQFWGENMIPTVSRDDPAYCDGLDGRGNYWRGNCWPPTTYIVYLAIKEAGWDAIAAEYARRVIRQFMEYWQDYGHAYENYPPEGKVDHDFLYLNGWGGREIRYVWSAMMLFCGLEEVFGPEVGRRGVRFGNPHLAEETAWHGGTFAGQRVDAIAGSYRTEVTCGDRWSFLAEPGLTVRGFHEVDGAFHFTTQTETPVHIRFHAQQVGAQSTVLCNGELLHGQCEGDVLIFTLPAGGGTCVVSSE